MCNQRAYSISLKTHRYLAGKIMRTAIHSTIMFNVHSLYEICTAKFTPADTAVELTYKTHMMAEHELFHTLSCDSSLVQPAHMLPIIPHLNRMSMVVHKNDSNLPEDIDCTRIETLQKETDRRSTNESNLVSHNHYVCKMRVRQKMKI